MKLAAGFAATAVAFALATPSLAQTPEAVTVIHAGTILAEPGKPALSNGSVIVRGRTIEAVQSGFVDVAGRVRDPVSRTLAE